ncbi:MAG TPA: ribbon-helix-helix domain-containing protein [Candidatus Nanoarchaeia archaeon]|nr:ribbon-helix-helix domain-containing protein [Candidatus Nanoarchaeia archaeon]
MGIKIVNVRIPSEVVSWLDTLVERGVYNSRAEALREFCRDYMRKRGPP